MCREEGVSWRIYNAIMTRNLNNMLETSLHILISLMDAHISSLEAEEYAKVDIDHYY